MRCYCRIKFYKSLQQFFWKIFLKPTWCSNKNIPLYLLNYTSCNQVNITTVISAFYGRRDIKILRQLSISKKRFSFSCRSATPSKLKECKKFNQNNKDFKDAKHFCFMYKLQKKLESIYLANYKYNQYIIVNIILLNSNLRIPPKITKPMFSFPRLILK